MRFDETAVASIFGRYKAGSKVFDLCIPAHFGDLNVEDEDLRCEIAAMLYAVETSDDDFTIISLGAAPGEWPLKAQQAYAMHRPDGRFRSISLEGDLHHYDLTRNFLDQNSDAPSEHDLRYQVVSHVDGFAYFPIVNPGIDWGAGIAAVAEKAEDLADNITMSEMAKSDRINANHGSPLEFRTVEALSLTTLLNSVGIVDLLHCDIQGAEQDVFPPQMQVLGEHVRICCIGTHGRKIEEDLLKSFSESGWTLEYSNACGSHMEGDVERVSRDGVFVWSNPRF